MDEILNDPTFLLHFSNTKSGERVSRLIDSIKSTFDNVQIEIDHSPDKALNLITNHPEKALLETDFLQYQNDENAIIGPVPGMASLRAFMVDSVPPSGSPKRSDQESEMIQHNFLSESRREHQRLLTSFQDRLVRDLCSNEEQMRTPFRLATDQIAHFSQLPIELVKEEPKKIQDRFSDLSESIQLKTNRLIQIQRSNAKLLTDRKSFENRYMTSTPSGPLSLPVSCPYAFLAESD